MNREEKITIGFKEQTGFRISKCDLTTGKVVVNGIEITSVEDWEKVTKSLIKLQNNWNKLKKWIKEYKEALENQSDTIEGLDLFEKHTLVILDDVSVIMQELEINND